tara:strand:+ start:1397 stop:2161 length:765 start_codon:yes stop_codon:yes gene_type:complete
MFSNELWQKPAGSSDPSDLSQSDFEAAFTTRSGASTFTYEDSTYGNYVTLVSPGGNTFYRNNSFYSGGFPKNSYIQYNISGYGQCGFGIYKNTNASNNTHFESLGSVSYNYILYSTAQEFTTTVPSFVNGANATSGNIRLSPHHGSISAGSYVFLATAKYYGDSNPVFFRTGLDEDSYFFFEVYQSGGTTSPPHDGTGFSKSGPYYMIESNSNLTTDRDTSGLVNFGDDNFQFAWGNYDGGAVETMRRLVVRTP